MGKPRKPAPVATAPKPTDGLGEPPEWFDALAREAWVRLGERLQSMGLGVAADSEAAMLYCVAYSQWRKAVETVASEGQTITTRTTVRAHPLLAVANEASRQMARSLEKFAMTPASRSNMKIKGPVEEDEVLAFLARATPKPGKART